jgi:two-component system nitrogen regulation response regulator NtrX
VLRVREAGVAGERILVVDDEPGVRAALAGILADEGYEVVCAASGEIGIEVFAAQPFDAVLLDVWLPGIDGLETLRRLRERRPDVEVVMISGHGTIDTAVRATRLGAFDFVEKPLSLERTLLVLRNALRQRRLEQRNRSLVEQLVRDTDIPGRSAAAEVLRREVEAAAASHAPVLIVGEPGSGRETVARRIHVTGVRAGGPFVDVPCAALGPDALAAALLGEPGSPGRVELARGGTLFLRDADRAPAEGQRRLAATLAGGSGARPVATASDVRALDRDLAVVLDVLAVHVPPLRSRREDVPAIAERHLRELALEYGREPKRLSAACAARLRAHDWPGNVRELRNLIERLLLLVPGPVIDARDLPDTMGGARPPVEDLYRDFGSLAEGVDAFERHFIARVLSEEGTDRDAAARRLGLTRQALDERLSRFD